MFALELVLSVMPQFMQSQAGNRVIWEDLAPRPAPEAAKPFSHDQIADVFVAKPGDEVNGLSLPLSLLRSADHSYLCC